MKNRKNKSGEKKVDYSGIFSSDKPDNEKIQAFGTILESIDSKMDLVLEATDATKNEFKREIKEFRKEANGRFDILEAVVRGHSDDIKGMKTKVDKMDNRLERVETKLDKNNEKLDNHEVRITALETSRL